MINLEKIKIELQNAIKNSPKTQVEIAKKSELNSRQSHNTYLAEQCRR